MSAGVDVAFATALLECAGTQDGWKVDFDADRIGAGRPEAAAKMLASGGGAAAIKLPAATAAVKVVASPADPFLCRLDGDVAGACRN